MSTFTDPATTPPGERIDTDPLTRDLMEARALVALVAVHYLESLDKGSALLDSDLERLREATSAERSAWEALRAAISHNQRRILTAREGISDARSELTKARARANGYPEPQS